MPKSSPSSLIRGAIAAGLFGLAGAALLPQPAQAQEYWGGYRRHYLYGHAGYGYGYGYGRSYAPYYAAPPAVYAAPPVYFEPPRMTYAVPAPVIRRPVQRFRAVHRAPPPCNCLPAATPPRPIAPVAAPGAAPVVAPGPAPAVVPPNQLYPPERFERPQPGDTTGRAPS